MKADKCQLYTGLEMLEPLGSAAKVGQFVRNRLKRMGKRRVSFALNFARKLLRTTDSQVSLPQETGFQSGDSVRIRSRDEIQSTLDSWNELKGCGFMEEMWPYCGTEHRVFKRVEQFLDERDYRVRQARGLYLLEGLLCHGTVDFGRCDRSCFFFWRKEWLEKIDS